MRYYDDLAKEKIRREYSAQRAIADTGRAVKVLAGGKISILCPGEGHHDKHFGNCQLFPDGQRCYCFACARSFDAFSILMDEMGITFPEAVDYAAESLGLTDLANNPNARPKKSKYRLLTKSERELLGLATGANSIFLAENLAKEKPKEVTYIEAHRYDDAADREITDYIIGRYESHDFLRELAFDDPEAYRFIIQNKALEAKTDYHELSEMFRGFDGNVSGTELSLFDFRVELLSMSIKAGRLCREFGGESGI